MTTTRLTLYNGALRLIGERKLASLTENREPRRVLDDAWDDGAVRFCLEQGLWNCAMRTIRIDYDPSVDPGFGYRFAFDKPEDWVRTAGVAEDEYFNAPLTRYTDEAGYWYSDLQTLYVRFVSDHASYGGDLSLWPQTLVKYVQGHLAEEICERITQHAEKLDGIQKKTKKRLTNARSKDAMNEGASFMPQGSWSAARQGGWRRDRARGTLIG